MKKFLIGLLAALACVLTVCAFGCKPDGGKNNGASEYTVEFVPTENLEYVCDALEDGKLTMTVKANTQVTFSVKVPTLYAVPAVYSNSVRITSNPSGQFRITVTGNVRITTAEVKYATSDMTGAGTSSDPIVVKNVVDLLHIAEQVNAGNTTYSYAYYRLGNDIDCGGETISVIGNGSNQSAAFAGNFNGDGHTISNFKINSQNSQYVGLFGYLVSTGTSGTGTVTNLKLDNFQIEAQAAAGTGMFVGAIAGYSMAGTVMVCEATNGEIIAHGDPGVFAIVGGAVGFQQSSTMSSSSSISYFTASTLYVRALVDIFADGGILAAGGVVGYSISDTERSISFVANSYAEGVVRGGIYSGGVIGYLGENASVANCYSVGEEIIANARYRENVIYSHAYAGGIAGFIGNGAVVSDSFAYNGRLAAQSAMNDPSYEHTGAQVGGYEEVSEVLPSGVLFNCKSGEDVSRTSAFFKNTLGWQECDWVIADGSYPVINLEEEQANEFSVTFDFGGKKVKGADSYKLDISLKDSAYTPLFYYYNESFGEIFNADDGFTSYGYFFDDAHTQRVPNGYIPTREITLYAGFSDYSEVAGVYSLVSRHSDRKITLELRTDGTYEYNDGITLNANYFYNGTKIIFNDSLFARLSGNVTVNNALGVARPDYNFTTQKFAAVKVDTGLEIFDGSYFLKGEPLKANLHVLSGEWYSGSDAYVFKTDYTGTLNGANFAYTLTEGGALTITGSDINLTGMVSGGSITIGGNTLTKYDVFKGVWDKAANIKRSYEFDGKNAWKYIVKGEIVDSGTYTVGGNGVATLKSGLTAELDASGLLLVKDGSENTYYGKSGSFGGTWLDEENDLFIYLDGYGNNLSGSALINISGAATELGYVVDGFFDFFAQDGKNHITLLNGYNLFGYLTVESDGTLTGSFFSGSAGTFLDGYKFYLVDTLNGDWVGEGELGGITFDSLNFNGMGNYNGEVHGSVSLNGGAAADYTLDDKFDASFAGNGSVNYGVSYDDKTDVITVTSGSNSVELYRKDEISSFVLIDNNGNKYAFNGGGNLSKGGKLTVTDSAGSEIAALGYKNASGSIGERDLAITLYGAFRGSSEVGSVTVKDNKFEFAYTGEITALKPEGGRESVTLTIDNPFTGSWSVSNNIYNIVIGTLDLSYKVTGNFLDMERTVEFEYLPEYDCLLVAYITGQQTTATPLYLISPNGKDMVISSYSVLTAGDMLVYCAHSDELTGDWVTRNETGNNHSLRFDGMADSSYTLGVAWDENSTTHRYTRRFGTLYFMTADGEHVYTVTRDGSATGENVFYKNLRIRVVFNEFDDSLPVLTATEGGTEYKFYLNGEVEVNGVTKEYSFVTVNGNVSELVIFENEEDEEGTNVSVDHEAKTVITH